MVAIAISRARTATGHALLVRIYGIHDEKSKGCRKVGVVHDKCRLEHSCPRRVRMWVIQHSGDSKVKRTIMGQETDPASLE